MPFYPFFYPLADFAVSWPGKPESIKQLAKLLIIHEVTIIFIEPLVKRLHNKKRAIHLNRPSQKVVRKSWLCYKTIPPMLRLCKKVNNPTRPYPKHWLPVMPLLTPRCIILYYNFWRLPAEKMHAHPRNRFNLKLYICKYHARINNFLNYFRYDDFPVG